MPSSWNASLSLYHISINYSSLEFALIYSRNWPGGQMAPELGQYLYMHLSCAVFGWEVRDQRIVGKVCSTKQWFL